MKTLVMAVMLLVPSIVVAQECGWGGVVISGIIEDECHSPVAGVNVQSNYIGVTVSSSNGRYVMYDLCASSYTITARKAAQDTRIIYIGNNDLREMITRKFTLTRLDTDLDDDGVTNCTDVCPEIPDGPDLGTCLCGSMRGRTCIAQAGAGSCGCAGTFCCDTIQFDWDNDGRGVACSACAGQVGGCTYPYEDGNPSQARDISDREMILHHGELEWVELGR